MVEFRELTDGDVAAAAGGSREHAERIAEALGPRIHVMVAARLSPTRTQFHAVEDLTQMSAMAIASAMTRLENTTVAGLKAFASVVVSRRVADFIASRRDGKSKRNPGSLDSTVFNRTAMGPVWQFLSASGTTPPSAAARSDQLALVLAELAHLTAQEREIINLAFFDELTTAQIGAAVGISRGAASMRLIRAVRALRARMRTRSTART